MAPTTSCLGSNLIKQRFFVDAKGIRITQMGYITTDAVSPGKIFFDVYAGTGFSGGSAVASSAASSLPIGLTDAQVTIDLLINIYVPGTTGTARAGGRMTIENPTTFTPVLYGLVSTSDFTIDTGVDNIIDVAVDFDSVGNTLVFTNTFFEILY